MLTATIVTIILYVIIMFVAGNYAKRWVSDSGDYMLAGREFGSICNTMELCAVALACSAVTLIPSLVQNFGVIPAIIGYPVALGLGFALYGLLYGKMSRDNGAQTVAEYLELRYNVNVRTMVSIAAIISMMSVVANNIISLSGMFSTLLGIPSIIIVIICFVVIIGFSLMSGFWGITLTDMIQVSVAGIAFIALAVYTIRHFGGFDWLAANSPSPDVWTVGLKGGTIPTLSTKYPSYLTLFLNYMIFLLWGSNYYYLRGNTCRNGKVATRTYVITGIIFIPLLMAPLAIAGAYSMAAHSEVFLNGTVAGSNAIAYLLKEDIPVPLVIIVLLGALAVTVSTASTAVIGVTSTISRDLYQRRINPKATPKQVLKVQRSVMLGVVVIGMLLCFYPGGTVYLFGFATSWLGPVAVLMFFASFWPRFTDKAAFWSALGGMAILTLSTILEITGTINLSNYIHSSILGLGSTAIIAVILTLLTEPPYYGDRQWERVAAASNRKDIVLNQFEMDVLAMTRPGVITLAEIQDYVDCDSVIMKEAIKHLDLGGYIQRVSLYGYRFYHFTITEKGIRTLLPLSPADQALLDCGLNHEQFCVLANANVSHEQMIKYLTEHKLSSLQATSIISLLDHRGYIRQTGVMKRRVVVTEQGSEIVSKYKAFI